MADRDDLPPPRRRDDQDGSIVVWAVTGMALVFGYILLLVILRPAP